jgi:hypothetical protein
MHTASIEWPKVIVSVFAPSVTSRCHVRPFEHAASHLAHVDREDLPDVALLDELAHVEISGRRAPLKAYHRVQVLLARERRELFGFLSRLPERPFAINVLPGLQRAFRERVVRGHAYRHERGLHTRILAHRIDIAIGALYAERLRRILCGIGVRRADRVELGLGQPRERRHVCPRSPSSLRADQAYTQAFAYCHGDLP